MTENWAWVLGMCPCGTVSLGPSDAIDWLHQSLQKSSLRDSRTEQANNIGTVVELPTV